MTGKLILLLAALTVQNAFGQTNTSVEAARCVASSGGIPFIINLTASPNCIAGKTRLYYQFYTDIVAPGPADLGTWSVSSSGTFTYKIYGPYPNMDVAYADVSSGSAIPAGSTITPSFSQVLQLGSNVQPGKAYIVELILNCSTSLNVSGIKPGLISCTPPGLTCDDCLGQFQPSAGKYIFSAWTKEEDALVTMTSYTLPGVELEANDGTTTTNFTFAPTGEIIDGWQQITGTFDVPENMQSLEIRFVVGGSGESALFDDIRIFPFDGSLMSYVYDPITLRLVAELDERNYAKLYEYDEEGKLVRVKKETEKGILTIQENRENAAKRP